MRAMAIEKVFESQVVFDQLIQPYYPVTLTSRTALDSMDLGTGTEYELELKGEYNGNLAPQSLSGNRESFSVREFESLKERVRKLFPLIFEIVYTVKGQSGFVALHQPAAAYHPCHLYHPYHLYHPAAIFHYITCTTLQQYSIISPVPPCSSKQYITCITHITRIARIILQQYTTRACYKQKLWSLCRRHSIKSAPILWDYVVVVAIRSGTVF
jgi:hypothetical protein